MDRPGLKTLIADIEVGKIFGVRSAYWKFSSGSDEPIIHLFPMCHIGDQEFYDEVLIRVSKCDIILVALGEPIADVFIFDPKGWE